MATNEGQLRPSDPVLEHPITEGTVLPTSASIQSSSAHAPLPETTLNQDVEEKAVPTYRHPLIPRWRLSALTLSLCSGLCLSLLDTSIVATALFSIGTEFNSLEAVNWVALAYTLAYLSCAVLFARMSDVVGRRNATLAAFVIFVAFSIGCGFARSLNELIAFRTIQGIGGSGLYSLTVIILPEIFPMDKTKLIGGLIGVVIAVAGVLGPVVGGIITQQTTWRWVFWMNGPIGLLALGLVVVAWPRADQLYSPKRSSVTTLDYTGGLLLIAASVLVVFAFQAAGSSRSNNVWGRGTFIGPIVAGGVCWIILVLWEMHVSKSGPFIPLLPKRLFAKRVYSAATLCTVTTGFIYFVIIYSLPIHFEVVYKKSALLAGVSLLPSLGSAALGSVLGGFLSTIEGARFLTIMGGCVIMALGTGLLSTCTQLTVENKIYGYQVLIGLGFGVTVSNISVLASRVSEQRDVAVAQGIVAQARVLGGSIGIAATTAILGVIQRQNLAGLPAEALSSPAVANRILTADQLTMVRQAYSDSFVQAMHVCAIIGAVGFVFSLGLFERSKLATNNEDQHLDSGSD